MPFLPTDTKGLERGGDVFGHCGRSRLPVIFVEQRHAIGCGERIALPRAPSPSLLPWWLDWSLDCGRAGSVVTTKPNAANTGSAARPRAPKTPRQPARGWIGRRQLTADLEEMVPIGRRVVRDRKRAVKRSHQKDRFPARMSNAWRDSPVDPGEVVGIGLGAIAKANVTRFWLASIPVPCQAAQCSDRTSRRHEISASAHAIAIIEAMPGKRASLRISDSSVEQSKSSAFANRKRP